MLSRLQRFNAVYVNQSDMDNPFGFGISNEDFRFKDDDVFRVPNFERFAIRKSRLERFERSPAIRSGNVALSKILENNKHSDRCNIEPGVQEAMALRLP